MKTPDIQKRADKVQADIELYLEQTVRPYLRHLMAKAQRRMWRHKLSFCDGMGVMSLDSEPESRWLNDAISDAALEDSVRKGKRKRIAERFPELVELYKIAYQLDEIFQFRFDIGDLNPETK